MRVRFGVLEQTRGLHLQAKFHLNAFIVSASGGQKPQFLAHFDLWGAPVPTRFTDEGQVWCANPRYTLTCQISSRSVYSVALCWRKTPILPFFGLRHLVLSLIGNSLTKLNTGAQLQAFPYPAASKSFCTPIPSWRNRAHNLWRSKAWRTDKQTKKSQRFWPPRRRVTSDIHQTWHSDRGPRARSCTSKTFWVWRIVSPLGGTENLGKPDPLNLKPPYLHNPSSKSDQILTTSGSWNGVQTLQILWKSRKGYAPAGRLYSTFWSNLSKNFSFWGPTPLSLLRWGWKTSKSASE